METRICKYCEDEYPIDQFEIARVIKSKIYRRWRCHKCYMEVKKARKDNISDWFDNLRETLTCNKCGEDRFYVLDFHHRNPEEKEMNLGDVRRRGWSKERILKEVAKCDVYCANCHRELHYLERSRSIA